MLVLRWYVLAVQSVALISPLVQCHQFHSLCRHIFIPRFLWQPYRHTRIIAILRDLLPTAESVYLTSVFSPVMNSHTLVIGFSLYFSRNDWNAFNVKVVICSINCWYLKSVVQLSEERP